MILKLFSNNVIKHTANIRRSFLVSSFNFKSTEELLKNEPVTEKFKRKTKGNVVDVWKSITLKELGKVLNKDIETMYKILEFVPNGEKYFKVQAIIDDWKIIEKIVHIAGCRVKEIPKPGLNNLDVLLEKNKEVLRRNKTEYTDIRFRPPVVTVMGHVDHGKTTLLDTLRNTSVVATEFGGITQHIGAFSIKLNEKDQVTFLDTPGHAAFCAMRNRGAQCTDIVVLVVATDDGVMEQTVESIRMAKEAGVPIIVALNKIDKPTSNLDRTKNMLMKFGLQVEDCGGDVQAIPISALKGTNIDVLMDAILVQAEVMELKTEYGGFVEGVVIESRNDVNRGKLCTVLVQVGILKKGCVLVAGSAWCKVRAIFNDRGDLLQNAGPSTPVQIIGWRDLPSAGDIIVEVKNEKRANEISNWKKSQFLKQKQEKDNVEILKKMEDHQKEYKVLLEEKRRSGYLYGRVRLSKPVEVAKGPVYKIVIKSDVDGSAEAILDVLDTYKSKKCQLHVVHYGVGPITINDVTIAKTFNAALYTFNTNILSDAKVEAVKNKIIIKHFNVIYKLIDDIKTSITSILPYKNVDEPIGEAEVLQEFLINEGKLKIPVAGSRCTLGSLKKSSLFKLIRNENKVEIYRGNVISLKHLKDEVDVIKKGMECGIRLGDNSVRVFKGDKIICFKIIKVPEVLDWDPGF